MGIVIGPISREDWKIMKMLKHQIAYIKTKPRKLGELLPETLEKKNKYFNKYIA